jgi:hypothetical protein
LATIVSTLGVQAVKGSGLLRLTKLLPMRTAAVVASCGKETGENKPLTPALLRTHLDYGGGDSPRRLLGVIRQPVDVLVDVLLVLAKIGEQNAVVYPRRALAGGDGTSPSENQPSSLTRPLADIP